MASSIPNSSKIVLKLQVGFSSIELGELQLTENCLKKGMDLFDAENIFDVVEERRPNTGICPKITSRCTRQTNTSNPPYTQTIQLDLDRKISSAHCSCNEGISGNCEHIACEYFMSKL